MDLNLMSIIFVCLTGQWSINNLKQAAADELAKIQLHNTDLLQHLNLCLSFNWAYRQLASKYFILRCVLQPI